MMAPHASVLLRKRSCHRMGPALHFRLLLVLCNDVASGSALRAEFQARIDEATHLSTQHRQLLIEVSYSAAPSYCNSMAVLMHRCSLLAEDCRFQWVLRSAIAYPLLQQGRGQRMEGQSIWLLAIPCADLNKVSRSRYCFVHLQERKQQAAAQKQAAEAQAAAEAAPAEAAAGEGAEGKAEQPDEATGSPPKVQASFATAFERKYCTSTFSTFPA